jgi:hypothetical protein
MRKILGCVTLFAVLLCGCDKPNPNPELLDPIYADVAKTAEEFKKQAEADRQGVEAARKELEAAVPQTHQNEYAIKRLREAQAKALRSEQLAKYYEVRAENRIVSDKSEYSKAWSAKKPWPDPAEYQQFLTAEKQAASKSAKWDVAKRRLNAGFAPPKEKKEAEAEKKAPHEHE